MCTQRQGSRFHVIDNVRIMLSARRRLREPMIWICILPSYSGIDSECILILIFSNLVLTANLFATVRSPPNGLRSISGVIPDFSHLASISCAYLTGAFRRFMIPSYKFSEDLDLHLTGVFLRIHPSSVDTTLTFHSKLDPS